MIVNRQSKTVLALYSLLIRMRKSDKLTNLTQAMLICEASLKNGAWNYWRVTNQETKQIFILRTCLPSSSDINHIDNFLWS